jgi:polyribonucleotide nucleotidyltransferase
MFRNTLREAGLNQYLFELANIREQDSWVHQNEPDAATNKAKDLVRMSVSRARLLEPLHDFAYEVVQKAVVVGGGSRLTAALSIAEQGFPAVLVDVRRLGNAGLCINRGRRQAAALRWILSKGGSNPLINRKIAEVRYMGCNNNFVNRVSGNRIVTRGDDHALHSMAANTSTARTRVW